MQALSKDAKLLTLSLVLRTMPREQQALLMKYFSPEVIAKLKQIEQETGENVEKLDWTPFYMAWPELQKILTECKREVKSRDISNLVEQQRPKLREYIATKLGKQKKGPPVFLSNEITKIIDKFIQERIR